MIYYDEAGYTGANLTTPDQPFFTLASVNYSSAELNKIKTDIGYDEWGREFHFKSMYTNYQGRDMLDKLFTHPLLNHDHVITAYADKRYCIYAQVVDILIEEFYHQNGVDIQRGAIGLAMANSLYNFASIHKNQALVHQFETNFVTMVRNTTVETVADFYRVTDQLILDANTSKEFKRVLSEIPQTITTIRYALPVSPFHMDLTVALFAGTLQKWYKATSTKNDICFDSSEPMFASLELIKHLRDMPIEEALVGYGSMQHVLPLPIGNISLAKSHEEFGIQVADTCASALYFILTNKKEKYEIFKGDLLNYPLFDFADFPLAPSSGEFIVKRMNDVDGVSPLDFICDNYE